jgi:hypothetical protein
MSVAGYAITTLQDVLNLGSEARMNYPGQQGNISEIGPIGQDTSTSPLTDH